MELHICNGRETLSDISKMRQVTKDQLFVWNADTRIVESTGSYLLGSLKDKYYTREETLPKYTAIKYTETSASGPSLSSISSFESTRLTTSSLPQVSQQGFSKHNCTFSLLSSGSKVGESYYLPVYPQEFSDNNNANFDSVSLLGRSVDYQVYRGSSRTVSFTLQMHEELVPNNYDYMRSLVSCIESACYPQYGTSGAVVGVPEVVFVIGSHFRIRGILDSCSASWKSPIIDGKLVNCDLSVSVRETTGPYSMKDIISKRGFR